MKARYWGFTSGVLSCAFLAGCAAWSPAPQFSQPYFMVDTGEAKTLHALARKQDMLATKCAEHNSCDHVYFTRALLGLYESRDNASKYFEKVIAVAPNSQLATFSKLWLQLIEYHAAPVEHFADERAAGDGCGCGRRRGSSTPLPDAGRARAGPARGG